MDVDIDVPARNDFPARVPPVSMVESRASAPTMQATEWTILGLAVLGAIVPLVTGNASFKSAAFHAGTAPAVVIFVLTLVHMWARRTGVMSSSKYLAMFTLILGAWMAMSGFVLRENAAYAWAILVIGVLLVLVSAYEAIRSPPSRAGRRPLDPRTLT